MQLLTQGLNRWRARHISKIVRELSRHRCEISSEKDPVLPSVFEPGSVSRWLHFLRL
jgi:hypothetical protein